ARKIRILIFNAENAFVADFHIGLDDGFPEAGTVAVSNGAESFRSRIEIAGCESEIEHAVLIEVFRKENRVFHMGMVNGALFSDRKSTRLNSSHVAISYAVFCLKK